PNRTVRRGAHVNAAVISGLASDLVEAPLDMEDAVAPGVFVQQHLFDADAVTEKCSALVGQAPRILGAELHVRRNWHSLPTFEILAGQQIYPAFRIQLQSGLVRGCSR